MSDLILYRQAERNLDSVYTSAPMVLIVEKQESKKVLIFNRVVQWIFFNIRLLVLSIYLKTNIPITRIGKYLTLIHFSKDKIKSCFICLTLSVEWNNRKNCNIFFTKVPQCLDNPLRYKKRNSNFSLRLI